MSYVFNQNGKVQEEALAGSNSDVMKATLRRLRYFKMTLPLLPVLQKSLPLPLSFCYIQWKTITNSSVGEGVTFKLIGFFFSIKVFCHRHCRLTGQQGKGGDHLLFHSTTSTRSRTLRHLFATLHVR